LGTTDPEDILVKIDRILSKHSDIEHEDIGPWSETSEITAQEREAEAYINGIDISIIQNELVLAIKSAEDPWSYIEFIIKSYRPTWVVQPYKFITSIMESKKLRKVISQAIPKYIANISSSEEPEVILKFLIDINPKNRQKRPIKNIVDNLLEQDPKLNPELISPSLVLNRKHAKIIREMEEYIGPIHYNYKEKDFEIKINTTYGEASPSKSAGYTVKNREVETFQLNSINLENIPNIMCELTSLRSLTFAFLPITTLPECIGNLTKLEGLYLDSNKLESLPTSIENLVNLYEIYIRSNNLKSLPQEIGNLEHLGRLMLNDNPLASLPKSMSRLTNLVDLYIQNTKLTANDLSVLKKLPNIGSFVYSCLGENLQRDGNLNDAVKAFKEVVKEDPDYAGSSVLYYIGNNLNSLGRYEEAEKYLQNAANFQSYKVAALISLGFSYYGQSKIDQAEETFNLALEQDKKKNYTHMISINLGAVYLHQNNFEKAEQMLTKAKELQPENGEAYYNLACLYARKGETDLSLDNLHLAIEYKATLLSGIDQDKDFDSIRSNKKFKTLVQQYYTSVRNDKKSKN
jgi:tetratricopeptide (TPR) repeat protein